MLDHTDGVLDLQGRWRRHGKRDRCGSDIVLIWLLDIFPRNFRLVCFILALLAGDTLRSSLNLIYLFSHVENTRSFQSMGTRRVWGSYVGQGIWILDMSGRARLWP